MQEALRKTADLVKKHPALLVPLAISVWINFYLEWFLKSATHFILHHWLIGHSVLGFSVPEADPTHEYVRRGMMLLLPFGLAMRVLIFSVSVAAFVLTARLVRELDERPRLNWKNALLALRARLLRVVLVSIALLVLFGVTMSLSAAVVGLGAFSFLRANYSFLTIVYAMTMVCATVVAWLLTPFCLKLIADRWADPIPPERKLWSWIAAIVVALMLILLQAYVTDWTPRINFAFEDAPLLRSHIVWPLLSFLMNLPLGLLWIFLAVEEFCQLEVVEIPSPS
jgi:hypothetical protein